MGTLVLSLDAELAWGFHHVDPPAERLQRTRRTWRWLVDCFDSYDVPATWAVVGHLFEDACDGRHVSHPAGERLCSRDVGDLPASSAWFADGLIDEVRAADVDHEIGGHGYTHVHFGHERMSPAYARRELANTRDAACRNDCYLSSFVFPVNEVHERRLVAEAGFDCYRGRTPIGPAGHHGRRARKAVGALLDRGAPPLVHPYEDEYGLVNVPASMYLFDGVGPLESIVDPVHGDPVTERALRGVDAAAEGDGVLHLWFHPHNVVDDRGYERIRRVVERAAAHRDRGDLRIETMETVAARTRDRERERAFA